MYHIPPLVDLAFVGNVLLEGLLIIFTNDVQVTIVRELVEWFEGDDGAFHGVGVDGCTKAKHMPAPSPENTPSQTRNQRGIHA